MPALIRPDVAYRESFLAAMAEFAEEGRAESDSAIGGELREEAERWSTPQGFAAYVRDVLDDEVRLRNPDWVLCTTWWWVEDADGAREYLGRIALRHELNPWLREVGGHVGYDVRRSRRREGHATAMLAAVLPHARRRGIDRLLITCDVDNLGSRRVIESAGGVLEDQRGGKLRYWVPVGG